MHLTWRLCCLSIRPETPLSDHLLAAVTAAGELTGLQAQVVAGSAACQPRALLAAKPAQHQQSRALLESNLAAALCLQSPQEYRRWLGAYAQLLTGKLRGFSALLRVQNSSLKQLPVHV